MPNWNVETTAGTKTAFPANASIASANPAIVVPTGQTPLPEQRIMATFTAKVQVAVPALTANALTTLTFNVPLASFPSPFKVAPGTTALVQASIALSGAPTDPTTQVHTTSLALSIVSGNGGQSGGGSGQWTIPPGSYQGPALVATVGVTTTQTGVGPQTVTFLVNAQMNGSASVVAPTPTLTPGIKATTSSAPTPVATPQGVTLTLSGGNANWTYPIPYATGVLPFIVATFGGIPGTSPPPELYYSNKTNTGVTINSTSNTDTRNVDVLAFYPT